MIEIIGYNGKDYPKFQSEGNAAQFIMPFATKFCYGIGYDVGCNREEWKMPSDYEKGRLVYPIDPMLNSYHAMNFPDNIGKVDFIFSSHCLEHLNEKWFDVLTYWKSHLLPGGVIFLYLPDYSQEYWRPWNNPKHNHILTPEIMKDAFIALGMKNIFVSGVDLMNSFAIVGEV